MTSPFTATVATEIAAANARRSYMRINQISAHTCYILLEDGAGLNVTSSLFTAAITQGQYFEVPSAYKGRVSAFLSGAGSANVTVILS